VCGTHALRIEKRWQKADFNGWKKAPVGAAENDSLQEFLRTGRVAPVAGVVHEIGSLRSRLRRLKREMKGGPGPVRRYGKWVEKAWKVENVDRRI
jgi:hypothetical protein